MNENHKISKITDDTTILYSKRDVECRKIFLIDKMISKDNNRILDIGCGNGSYFSTLKNKGNTVIGIDINKTLCRISSKRGYAAVIMCDARNLPFKNKVFDCVWASEIIEHFPNLNVMSEIERVTNSKLLITMPNPIFPCYPEDITHILKYSIFSLKKEFEIRKIDGWNYCIRGLGYRDYLPIFQKLSLLSLIFTWYLPWFAPTITVIGSKKE